MGKGDKKSKKGKRFRHSYGKTRVHKKKIVVVIKKKVEEKPKPVEQKKPPKPPVEQEQPAVITQVVEDVKIPQPQIIEIKEEVQTPEIIQAPVSDIPSVPKETIQQETEQDKTEKEIRKEDSIKEKVKPVQEAAKKRGRPKKEKG